MRGVIRSNEKSERRLAAILFADIEGFTAIMQQNEALGRDTLAKFRHATKIKVPQWSGDVTQYYGDGCLCLYDSAVNALQCAIELQREFRQAPQVPVRMGIHLGDIFVEADHVYGDSINIASRIESMGTPGSILFSQSVHSNIKNNSEFMSRSLGAINFKNVAEPIPVHGLTNEGLVIPNTPMTSDSYGLQILVIEDEPLAADRIIKIVKQINPNHVILDTLDTVEDSIAWLKEHRTPDVILSDIQLADGLSLRIFADRKISCPIIFTTAFEKYAIQAFELNGVDYLLKPIKEERLREALDRCIAAAPQINESSDKLLEEFKALLHSKSQDFKTRFLCKLGNKIKSVPIETVRYFYSQNKITFIVTDDGNRYPANHTLDEVEDLVDPRIFFRVNRQFVVHFDSINEIQPHFKGRLKLSLAPSCNEEITISSGKSPLFKAWLDR